MNERLKLQTPFMPSCQARSLPRPIRTETEHERSTEMLLELDERADLSPEEEALAEMLTLLIENYETKYHPQPRVSPNESFEGPHARAWA